MNLEHRHFPAAGSKVAAVNFEDGDSTLRPSSRTIATASRWNSDGYFAGRPGDRFMLDMDFLLYEVSPTGGCSSCTERSRAEWYCRS